MSNFFDANFIQINGRYINKNQIVLIKHDPYDDNEVYIALSNGDQLWFNGTLNQLKEKIDNAGLISICEEVEKLRAISTKPEKREVERLEQYDIMRNCTVVRIKYDDGTYEDILKD